MDLNDPTTVALLAADAFRAAGHRYALYGGLLTAVYGEPRETRDADFAIVDVSASQAAQALSAFPVHTTIAFERVELGGLSLSRLTIVRDLSDGAPGAPAGLNTIDLVLPRSGRYASVAVQRAVTTTLRQRTIRLLTLEDFILFKVLSTRDRDLEDARAAMARSGHALDRELVADEVVMLSNELPDVDVVGRWASIDMPGSTT